VFHIFQDRFNGTDHKSGIIYNNYRSHLILLITVNA